MRRYFITIGNRRGVVPLEPGVLHPPSFVRNVCWVAHAMPSIPRQFERHSTLP